MSAPILDTPDMRGARHINPCASHRLVIEDAKGPEVTLEILSDSLLQITLRCKLYLSLLE